jgi:hypothetical protein
MAPVSALPVTKTLAEEGDQRQVLRDFGTVTVSIASTALPSNARAVVGPAYRPRVYMARQASRLATHVVLVQIIRITRRGRLRESPRKP